MSVQSSGPVSEAFLGGGRSVGPSTLTSASTLTVDDERQMAALLSELDRQPLPARPSFGSDGYEDEDEEDDRQQQRARLGDIALFAQPDAFTDTLQRVYESDERLRADRQQVNRRTQRLADRVALATSAAAGGTDGSAYYSVLPPRPVDISMDDDTYDLHASSAGGETEHTRAATATSSSSSSPRESAPLSADLEYESQHVANVAALSRQSASLPPNKKKRQSAAFAFSSLTTSDAARRNTAGNVSSTTSAAHIGTVPAAGSESLGTPGLATTGGAECSVTVVFHSLPSDSEQV